MNQAAFNFIDQTDICKSRHRGASTSVAANKKVAPHKENMRDAIVKCLMRGPATLEQVAKLFGTLPHKISGRLSELQKLKVIEPTGIVINGFREYRIKK